jgi:N-acetylglutamate synthase-like GNAT family acetyltransferase
MIRRAAGSDWQLVRQITLDAYAKWVPVIGREPLPMTVDYAQAVIDHQIDLLEVDGSVVGLIELVPGARHLLIENVAINPACQGQGYGRVLMEHALTVARNLGLPEVRLYTNKLFAENIRFYEALGYQLTQEQPFRGGTVCHFARAVA